MSKVIQNEVHARRHRVIIDRHELTRVITALATSAVGITDNGRIKVDVKFSDATEGSPSYKVGVECVVSIEEDLSPAKTEEQIEADKEAFMRGSDGPRVDLAALVGRPGPRPGY